MSLNPSLSVKVPSDRVSFKFLFASILDVVFYVAATVASVLKFVLVPQEKMVSNSNIKPK